MTIAHPFHPLRGETFDVISRSPHWGEERVVYRAADGTLPTIAVSLTDLAAPDLFQQIGEGRAAFRIVDLQRLVSILDQIPASLEGADT